ncbi:MAG TPA: phasin family protein [bacterium]|nr:phasin family protein [bacterium]
MVDKAKDLIPDFLKEGVKNVREPLAKAEKAIEKARDRLMENWEKLDPKDVKGVYDELLKRVRSARDEFEGMVTTGVEKTFTALNLPSRDEVDGIKTELNKISKTVNELAKGAPAKKAVKKAPAKTPVKKAAPKKAVKTATVKKRVAK